MLKYFILPQIMFVVGQAFGNPVSQDTLKRQDIETITIVGDKSKSIPGSGQFINSIKIEKLNQPNINHVLRMIPGINIRDEEGFGLRPNIGLRGTQVNRSAKITLMEDGILIAPAPYSDPSAYYFPTFSRMQGLEVLKGSSQIKYGPYTIGGALNLLSTAIPASFQGFAQFAHGSFGTNQQRLWVGDSRKNIDYVFEVNRMASKGFKELENGDNTGFDRRDIMGKLRWHSNEDANIFQSLTFKFISSSEEGNETYLGLTYDDYRKNPLKRYAGTQNDLLDMNHNHISLSHLILPAKGLRIHTTAYYSYTFRDWGRANSSGGQSLNAILQNPEKLAAAYQILTGKANGNLDFQNAARTYLSKGLQSNLQYLFNTGNLTHNLQFGIRYHEDQADRYATRSVFTMTDGTMVLTSAGIKGNQENQIRNASSLATFFNYDFNIKGLKVSPGIRFEKINFDFQNYGNADNARLGTSLKTAKNELAVLLPGVGFNYRFNESFNFLGGIHRGFSPPGMPSVTSTTVQAKIESSTNYELGYQLDRGGFSAKMLGFFNDYTNILGSDNISGGGAGTGDLFNAGKAHVQGFEISLEYNLLQRRKRVSNLSLPFNIAYTFTDAEFQETFINGGGDWGSGLISKGDKIPFITPHLLTASIGISSNKMDITLSSRYTGITRVKPGKDEYIFPSEKVAYSDINALNSFLLFDLSANYRFTKSFAAFTTIQNLTNNQRIVANLPQGFRPNMPININFGLKLNF